MTSPQSHRVARMDRDTVTGRRQCETILLSFGEDDYDILVVADDRQGHEMPNAALAGVVNADVGCLSSAHDCKLF